ncbi:MAG: phosphoglucosamine mutase [Bilifractor sp.]
MGRYFGTDGIRGKANEGLTASRAFEVGRYLGYYYSRQGRSKIIIGKDTRLSSDMLENALAAGIASEGCDAYLAGYCPTPMICYLTVHEDFSVGAMISASHNPFYDNGIKVFSKEGIKLQGEVETLIEDYIDGKETIAFATGEKIGRIIPYPAGIDHYIDYICRTFPTDLSGMRIAMDCANGSSTYTAEKVLTRLGANCTVMNNQPNGTNINNNCGSTHPDAFCEFMKKGNFDLGLTFDGDADRQIPVRPDGALVDGDFVLYICGKYYRDKGMLKGNTVVTTVMANIGFWKAMEREGIHVEKTDVGDKYVYDCMLKNGYIVGGEQSGHIIFSEYETTGDGLVTALALLKIMRETGRSIRELCEGLKIYPQLLVNVQVSDKNSVMEDPDVKTAIEKANKSLKGNGRILVRPSGTEPLLRVMAEAETDQICEQVCGRVAETIRSKYGV